ncbi:MAG: hypothetical protein A2X46_04795 [Lentisphaerae bacterium GWF2_57_35]|nr:MAG: hypothetical protein A2X46_04795 [Lentisphaerae bacterium GWF2_57_35]
MRQAVLAVATVLVSIATANASLIGADHAGNYGGSWNTGSNGGTNFGAWSISASGTAGTFIGDPAAAGIAGMNAASFGMYANPNGPGNYVNADRAFGGGAMVADDVFSLVWGVNWDSDGTGNKGFNLYSGGAGGTQLININMGGSSAITYDIGGGAQPLFNNYGVNGMLFSFWYLGGNQLRLQVTGRDGVESFDQTLNLAGSPDSFRLYASDLATGDQRQPYVNDFSMTHTVPEPGSLALIGLGIAGVLIARRMRK